MRIWVSLGSVTTADWLLVLVVISLLLFQLVQKLVERLEALVPRLSEADDPVVDRLERPAIEPVHAVPALVSHGDQAHLAQDAQVLGHLRLSDAEQPDQVAHRTLAAGEQIQDLAPARLRHGVERVRRRRRSRHEENIYPYGNMSSGPTSPPLGAPSRGLQRRRHCL